MLRGLSAALRHLTILPLPWQAKEARLPPAAALPWFPVAGLVVGSAVAGALLLPLPPLARPALALAVWTLLTGALHEDAWMDSADAALAIASRERRLAILKDPHAGAHAVTALVVAMLLRFGALAAVAPVAAIVAAVCGRWVMVLTLARLRPARQAGLGAAFARGARAWPASLVGVVLIGALTALLGPRVSVAAAFALLAGFAVGVWLSGRFGGLTGDGHGAAGFAAETVALLAFLPIGTGPGGFLSLGTIGLR